MNARVFFTVHHSKQPLDFTALNFTICCAEKLTDYDIAVLVNTVSRTFFRRVDRVATDEIVRQSAP